MLISFFSFCFIFPMQLLGHSAPAGCHRVECVRSFLCAYTDALGYVLALGLAWCTLQRKLRTHSIGFNKSSHTEKMDTLK